MLSYSNNALKKLSDLLNDMHSIWEFDKHDLLYSTLHYALCLAHGGNWNTFNRWDGFTSILTHVSKPKPDFIYVINYNHL